MARTERGVDLTAPWRAIVQVVLAALIVSGVALGFGYDAAPSSAREGVANLPAQLRALHHWAGLLTMAAAVGFAVRVWLRGADRERAYPSWGGVVGAVIGAGLLFLGGRMLAWDDVGWGLYRRFAWLGGAWGERNAVLPSAEAPLFVLVLVHALIGVVATAVLVLIWRRHDGRAWSAFLHRALVMPWAQRLARRVALAFLVFLVAVVVFFPPALGPPLTGTGLAPAPWPFAWTIPLEKALGIGGFWVAFLGGCVLVGALPLAGRASMPVRVALAIGIATTWLALGVAALFLQDGF